MTQKEMLEALGLTDNELKDLLQKFREFLKGLNEPQQEAVKRSLPTLAEALKGFDRDVTEEQLLKLFEGDKQQPPVILVLPCRLQKSRR